MLSVESDVGKIMAEINQKNRLNIRIKFDYYMELDMAMDLDSDTLVANPVYLLHSYRDFCKKQRIKDNDNNFKQYLLCCLLHEAGHCVEKTKTNFFKQQRELISLVKNRKYIPKMTILYFKRLVILEEEAAWHWSKNLRTERYVDGDFFETVKCYSLYTYYDAANKDFRQDILDLLDVYAI